MPIKIPIKIQIGQQELDIPKHLSDNLRQPSHNIILLQLQRRSNNKIILNDPRTLIILHM